MTARVETVVPPSPLRGTNGVAFGPDGRLWIASFLGGTVSALDVATGAHDVLVGPDGPLAAPDDLAVDHRTGAVYVVDLPPGLVWRRDPDATMTVVADGVVAPDGIAVHEGRLFVNELCPDGRLLEIDLDGGPPRVMATGLALGNAMTVGPDRRLYHPHLLGGEVWRVDLDGGRPERVLAGLDMPVAVRVGPGGRLLVLQIDEPGTLISLDLASGERRTTTTGVAGPDNLAVGADGTLHVSSAFRGGVTALTPGGRRRTLLDPGLLGPWDLTVAADGRPVVADHHAVVEVADGGGLHHRGFPGRGLPSGVRGVAQRRGELAVTTERGGLHVGDPDRGMRPLADLDGPQALAALPDGLVVAEGGAGRVRHVDDTGRADTLAEGLGRPAGVGVDPGGDVYATDAARGQVVRLRDRAVLAAGLRRPEGLAVLDGALWCLEAGAGRLVRIDPRSRRTEAALDGLALGVLPDHAGHATQTLSTRPAPFAGLAVDGDALLVGTSGDGGVLRVTPS